MQNNKTLEGKLNLLRIRAERTLQGKSTHNLELAELSNEEAHSLLHELQVHQIELEMQNEELRRTQVELAESRDKYLELYDFAPAGYFTLDGKGWIHEANLTGADMLGFPRSKLLKMKFSSFVLPDFQDEFYFHCKQLFETETHQTCDLKLRKQDGTPFYVRLDSAGVRDNTLNLSKIRIALTDITTERRAGEIISESNKKLNLMFNQMVSGSALAEVIFNKNGKPCDYHYLEVNPAFENITGKKRSQVIGKTMLEVFPDTERYWLQSFEQVALTGNPVQVENYYHDLDKYFLVSCFRPQAGQVALTFIDISERIQYQKALQKSHEELEKQVDKRTAELAKSNASLKREIVERRRLSYRFLNAQEDERRRIALRLHDDLGQDLSLLKLQVDSTKRQLSESQISLKRHIESISALLSNTIERVRGTCQELIPPVLVDLGLMPALRSLIQSSAKYANIKISSDILLPEDLFSPEHQTALYRIFQEILNNIIKHAQATQVSISVGRNGSKAVFKIEDNGVGFSLERIKSISAADRGLGLAAMEERVKMLDGNFEIFSRVGTGTKIGFEVPVVNPP